MGNEPARLFAGMISNEETLFEEAKERLIKLYGPVDFESPVYPWRHTSYYEEELGKGLKRRFVFFKELISQERLAEIKLAANEIESSFKREDGSRRINIDPGYITAAKVVLASTKDHAHRVYLGKGIFAEVTLQFVGKSFRSLDHTFPDFRTREQTGLFNNMRERYMMELKKSRPSDILSI